MKEIMLKKIYDFICKLIFGEDFTDGYVDEPKHKDKYIISSIFPDESTMNEAIGMMKKENGR